MLDLLVTVSGDETVNRMQEASSRFDSICNSRWYTKTSIIQILNKIDRFKRRLQWFIKTSTILFLNKIDRFGKGFQCSQQLFSLPSSMTSLLKPHIIDYPSDPVPIPPYPSYPPSSLTAKPLSHENRQ